jgi:hypothetical protein
MTFGRDFALEDVDLTVRAGGCSALSVRTARARRLSLNALQDYEITSNFVRDFAPCERFRAALASRTSCITRGRSGWLARPSPWGTFTSYSSAAFLAHPQLGHLLP